jgi:hypothetical protein
VTIRELPYRQWESYRLKPGERKMFWDGPTGRRYFIARPTKRRKQRER